MSESDYDEIGIGYKKHRQADPRIADVLHSLLNLPSGSVIADIGAGTGNYSIVLADKGFKIKAIEPSNIMRMQSLQSSKVEGIVGFAEDIPLPNNSVNGVIIILALHHFISLKTASNEIYRICPNGPIVVFTHDPRECADYWFSIVAQNIASGKNWSIEKVSFPLPYDLVDKFTATGWRTPEIYLDPSIRNSMSPFALTDAEAVEYGVKRLQNDLKSGEWDNKYGQIRYQCYLDAGYRFLRFKSNENANK
jgi:ubiquinone/menaquinone biosynthesis C-methylase UbiE